MKGAWGLILLALVGCSKSSSSSGELAASPIMRAYGPKVGSPGAVFEGVVLGDPEDRAVALQRTWPEGEVVAGTRDGVVIDLAVNAYDARSSAACPTVARELAARWPGGLVEDGASSVDGSTQTTTYWIDQVTQQRAQFTIDATGCQLFMERYAALESWIASVPLDLVGKPEADVAGKYHPDAVQTHRFWNAPGPGPDSRGATTLDADIADGLVVGLVVDAFVKRPGFEALRAALVKTLGAEPVAVGNTDGDAWIWDRPAPAPRVQLAYQGELFKLAIGGRPVPADRIGAWTRDDDNAGWVYRYPGAGDFILFGTHALCEYVEDRPCPDGGDDCEPPLPVYIACPAGMPAEARPAALDPLE